MRFNWYIHCTKCMPVWTFQRFRIEIVTTVQNICRNMHVFQKYPKPPVGIWQNWSFVLNVSAFFHLFLRCLFAFTFRSMLWCENTEHSTNVQHRPLWKSNRIDLYQTKCFIIWYSIRVWHVFVPLYIPTNKTNWPIPQIKPLHCWYMQNGNSMRFTYPFKQFSNFTKLKSDTEVPDFQSIGH